MRKRLTNPTVWHVSAGGTFAASNKNGYSAYTTIGRYMISPMSSPNNVERHIGYNVQFINEKGKLPGGLWQQVTSRVDLRTARQSCTDHCKLWEGELVLEQLPS